MYMWITFIDYIILSASIYISRAFINTFLLYMIGDYFDILIQDGKRESRRVKRAIFIHEFTSWLIVVAVGLLIIYCLIY